MEAGSNLDAVRAVFRVNEGEFSDYVDAVERAVGRRDNTYLPVLEALKFSVYGR